MSQWTQADVDRIKNKRVETVGRPSKYKNVKVQIHGESFDSKREAAYWMGLKAREAAEEIYELRRQVPFELCCPPLCLGSINLVVAHYVADFVFREHIDNRRRVLDSKGHRTQMYALKAKWMFLQYGIPVEEV